MRRIKEIFQAIVVAVLLASSLTVGLSARSQADSTNAPSLVISQFKITSANGQFFTLYNATSATLDMSKYQLEYFNSYDLTKATSSKLIALAGTLPPHGYFMVNDSGMLLCYQLTVDSVSLGLSSTAGMVEIVANSQPNPGSPVTPVLQDYVSWSKTAASGAQTLPANTNAFLQRLPTDAKNNPSVTAPGAGSWQGVQSSSSDACSLVSSITNAPIQAGMDQLLPGAEPLASIVTLADDGLTATAVSFPEADIGLMAPLITEVLPNPAGSGNDGTDEFIELYNPNDVDFDLSNFSLQAGTTTLHEYTFPAGTSLPPKGYVAYTSATTKLSLSNSGGQVKLLDPYGNAVYATAVYSTANDGQAWALANGNWYWTTKPTPGASNVIVQPPAKKSSSRKSAAKANSSKTKAVKSKSKKLKATKTKAALTSADSSTASGTPIHSSVLALVAGLALLYGAYEYRTDIKNRVYQLRRYFRARAADRP
jgi:hypothetical protein